MGVGSGGALTGARRDVTGIASAPYRFGVPAFLALAVAAFSGLWRAGALVIDGPGMSLYVRLSRDHLLADGQVPYWMTEIWAGVPLWAIGPSLPVFLLVPLAAAVGADVAVKIAILAFQVAGGWGAFVLARSLWGRTPAAVLAGLVYALHPVFVAHGALGGAETSAGVMAATPWMIWSLRKALRGEGTRYVVVAGLVAAFAVLHQAESAYALAVVCGCMLAVELGRVRNRETPSTASRVVGRMGAVLAVSLGALAHWLLPFLALGDSFIGSPPELVRGDLFGGIGASVGQELGIFLNRSGGLDGTVSFDRLGLLPEFFYLSWVCVALTFVTIGVLARRRDEVYLTAVLLASAIGVWMSSGAIPLAESGSALRHQVGQLLVTGIGAGLLLGAFVKRLHLRRAAPVALVASLVLLAALPYLTPLPRLQQAVPLLASLRFPRFFLIAPLGLALGAAYPVTLVERWVVTRPAASRARLGPVVGVAAALAVAAAFLVDVAPYRSFYRVHPPASGGAYAQVSGTLAADGGEGRVALGRIDPRSVSSMVDTDRDLSVGWPFSVASKQVWRLAGEPYVSPPGYREATYGLTGTRYLAVERPADSGTAAETIAEVTLLRNPRALPLVRAYDQAVVVQDPSLAPVLATSLAHRNVGVVTGGAAAVAALGPMTIGDLASTTPCDGASPRLPGGLGGEVGIACSVDTWMGALFAGYELDGAGNGVGAVFTALAGDLQGVSAWLDRPAGRAELALYDMADGGLLGRERARGQAVATDEYGLATFTFDRIPDSAGRRFAFVLTCPGCSPDSTPMVVTSRALRGPGNLIDGDRLVTDRTASFAPLYQRLARAEPSKTTVRSTRPTAGQWRIETAGTQPSLVVVAESNFPGWRASVDGRPVPVLEADGAFVGVPVEAGDHVVTLDYRRPAAATAGRLITGATLLTLFAVGGRRRQRRLVAEDTAESTPPAPPPPVDRTRRKDRERPQVLEPVSAATDDALDGRGPPVDSEEEQALEPEEPVVTVGTAWKRVPEPEEAVAWVELEEEPVPEPEEEHAPELEELLALVESDEEPVPELEKLLPPVEPEEDHAPELDELLALVEPQEEHAPEPEEPLPTVEAEEEPVPEPLPPAPRTTAEGPGDEGDEAITVVELVESTVPRKASQRRRRKP